MQMWTVLLSKSACQQRDQKMSLCLSQLAETAAYASARSSLIIESSADVPESQLRSYWQNCRSRSNEWIRRLDEFTSRFGSEPISEHAELWRQAEGVLNEVFVSEILTRVWAAILTAHDRRRFRQIAEPIARHTVAGHNEARHKALLLMVSGPEVPLAEVARVDRVRRKAERWTDLLLGSFVLDYGLSELAFESDRSIDFAQSQLREVARASDETVFEFILTGVRLAFRGQASQSPASEAHHRNILKAVMASFPADVFDEFGGPKSTSRVRAERGSFLERPLFGSPLGPNLSGNKNRERISFSELRLRQRDE